MSLRQGSRPALRALRCLQGSGAGAGALAGEAAAAGAPLRSVLPPRASDADADASRALLAARPAARAGCIGGAARGRHATLGGATRGFAAAAGGEGGDGSSSSSSSGNESSSSSSSSGSDSGGGGEGGDAESPALPQAALDDPLAIAYRLSKMPDTGLGLPPLAEIMAHDPDAEERAVRRATERAKQEQIAAARVRTVDEQGRAYATGKRKEAIARVWIVPGRGDVVVNDKALDVYFPDATWRVHVLYPFMVTGTLAAFDVRVTVRGGGPSGQAQAVRHGVAKALQAWEPGLRPHLREVGLLTRDSRVVERKKPGKAKARKSFQWVKR